MLQFHIARAGMAHVQILFTVKTSKHLKPAFLFVLKLTDFASAMQVRSWGP
jgi:hypothetical protein